MTDKSINLKFVQRYLSPVFEDFQSLVLEPQTGHELNGLLESRHQISSSVCRGVCDNGHIIWANSCDIEKLVGLDIPFHTAVGVPICSVGNDLYILVAFAVKRIPMTPTAIDYFNCFVRAVAKKTGGFLTTSLSGSLTSPPETHKFEGRPFEINSLVEKYTMKNNSSLLSKSALQKHSNVDEVRLFDELFHEYKSSRPSCFTSQQLDNLRVDRRLPSSASSVKKENEMSEQALTNGLLRTERSTSAGGAYCALGDTSSPRDHPAPPSSSSVSSSLQFHAHAMYRQSPSRFHEFMIALLGITVFDCAELWLLQGDTASTITEGAELQLMAAVYHTSTMETWVQSGIEHRLAVGCDVPGKVVLQGTYCWEHPYVHNDESTSGNEKSRGPRESAARSLGIHTAFGVPITGPHGPIGALVLYASSLPGVESGPDPVLVQLVERALVSIATPQDNVESGVAATSVAMIPALAGTPNFSRRLEQCREILQGRNTNVVVSDLKVSVGKAGASSAGDKAVPVGIYTRDSKSSSGVLCVNNYCHSPSSSDDDEDLTEEQVLGMRASFTAAPSQASKALAPTMIASSSSKTASASSSSAGAASSAAVISPLSATASAAMVGAEAAGALTEDTYPDAVVNAARALANFGNFQWGTFLEGSGIEENSDGYTSIRLGSDKILDMYGLNRDGSRKRKHDRLARQSNGAVAGEESGIPVCLVDGCNYIIEGPESQYCSAHRGTRRCQKEGCGKCAQGATKFCIAHGGGRRCTYPGCFKGARDKLFCAAHGGGKRCTFENCTKSAVGGSLLCTAHGGGKRCKFDGCNKSSQSSTDFCVKHGGGRSCMFKGCNKVITLMNFLPSFFFSPAILPIIELPVCLLLLLHLFPFRWLVARRISVQPTAAACGARPRAATRSPLVPLQCAACTLPRRPPRRAARWVPSTRTSAAKR